MEFRDLLLGGELKRIDTEVDPYLEAASISIDDQKTPWIAPVKGYPDFRMAGNVISTRNSWARALGIDVDSIPETVIKAGQDPKPCNFVGIPGEYMEVDTDRVPIPTYFKTDGGPYVTSGIFHAGIDGKFNLSFHRMMYMGSGKFAVRVVPRHLNELMREAKGRGSELEAVVSIGTDPAALLAGSTSLPFGKDEMEVASHLHHMLHGSPMELFSPVGDPKGPGSPKGTEVVLYGRFSEERVPEGPFVDVTSTIDVSGMRPGEPLFKVEKALIRKDPIMHVLLPGGFEHYMMMGLPKEPSIMRSVRKVVPNVHGVRLTEGGCCWLHGVVSITKQKEGDGKNAVMAAFSGHPSMKRVIIVDEDIDIFDDYQIEWALATRFQADRDMVIIKNSRGSTLDPSANPKDKTTSKLGLDATMPLKGNEPFIRVR
jgi:UbiD family decarboxylase